MTEEEAKKALFQIHWDYMMHTKEERLQLYDEYQEKRRKIKHELAMLMIERKQKEIKTK